MPSLERRDTAINYEERKEGFQVLLIAPGGLRSPIDTWSPDAVAPGRPTQTISG